MLKLHSHCNKNHRLAFGKVCPGVQRRYDMPAPQRAPCCGISALGTLGGGGGRGVARPKCLQHVAQLGALDEGLVPL